MIITPYSAATYENQDLTEFPCVKHFFPCEEVAGTNTISDVVGDVVLTANGLTRPDSYSVATSTTTTQTTSGTWCTPGTNPFVVFAVSKFGTAILQLGSLASTAISLDDTGVTVVAGGSGLIICDGTDFTLTTADTIYGRSVEIATYNSATGQRTREFTSASVASALAQTPTDATSTGGVALTTMDAISSGAAAWRASGNIAIYGIALFQFASMPSDLATGLAWMTNRWANGEKVIYPAWKGLNAA